MTLETIFYWLPYCSTCKKAKQFLDAKNVQITHLQNLKDQKMSREDIARLVQTAGGVNELFSRRAVKYRELGLHERELSESEMLDLMTAEYTFIKRPVLVRDGKAIAGFSDKNYEKFLNE